MAQQHTYNENTVILKVEEHAPRTIGKIQRITGFVKIRSLGELITKLDLDANPRSSKRSSVTKDIIETIKETPDLYPFKSKGILLGASECVSLDRGRYSLTFNDRRLEGILDGGHNTLAIALFLLETAGVPERDLKKIQTWSGMKEIWGQYEEKIIALKRQDKDPSLNAMVPVEILVPALPGDESSVNDFMSSILFICAARNNNVQLKDETVANQAGIFNHLKQALPSSIRDDVSWRTNDGKRIDVRFLVSLAWVPLGMIDLPKEITPLAGNTAYSGKQQAIQRFTALIEHEKVSTPDPSGNGYLLTHQGVESALKMVNDVLETYDIIYRNFKESYNSNPLGGSFGRILAVKSIKAKTAFFTPFGNEPIDHEVPPLGYIMPFAYSLQALLKKNEDGTLHWLIQPQDFFSDGKNMQAIMEAFKGVLEMADFDPQKVGKNTVSYSTVRDRVRTLYFETLQ